LIYSDQIAHDITIQYSACFSFCQINGVLRAILDAYLKNKE